VDEATHSCTTRKGRILSQRAYGAERLIKKSYCVSAEYDFCALTMVYVDLMWVGRKDQAANLKIESDHECLSIYHA
jgi:hypothetical protein